MERYLLPENIPSLNTIQGYRQAGGYQSLEKALKTMAPEQVVDEVKRSNLRGRGGAGFPTGLKWTFMPKEASPGKKKFLVCNSDESEPGTFKDRQILERNPHVLVEGLLIAGYAIGASAAWVYVRGEFVAPYRSLRAAVDEAYAHGLLGPNAFGPGKPYDIFIHRGAGAYICGEETALMESVEGNKGQPRKRPPFPAMYGIWGNHSNVNNVESISNVPFIVRVGAEAYSKIGAENCPGNMLFGISGHVNRPGVYELPTGTTLRSLIYDHAGGIRGGRQLKAVIPGGSSAPALPADKIDVSMDPKSLQALKSVLGTGGVIVMDDTTCMARVGIVAARFYRHESCGQCTQCREGTAWLHKIYLRIERGEATEADLDMIPGICEFMEGKTICALSDAAAWAAGGILRNFRDELLEHIQRRGCPFPNSFAV